MALVKDALPIHFGVVDLEIFVYALNANTCTCRLKATPFVSIYLPQKREKKLVNL